MQTVEVVPRIAVPGAVDEQHQRAIWHRPLVSWVQFSAFGVVCAKTVSAAKAIPRWQSHHSDSMGNGGTHEAWQAASNRLISHCNQVYDDFQSSSYACLTVTNFHPSLSSSLAGHEGQTPKYQHLSRNTPECRPIAATRGAYHAA
jgi:hypothetical protein